MRYAKEDLPIIKAGVEKNLPDIEALIAIINQRSDIDPRVKTLLKIRFIIPAIRNHEEIIGYIEQLISEDAENTAPALLHAASSVESAGEKIAKNIMIDIDDSLVLDFFPIPKDINSRVETILASCTTEDKKRFSLELDSEMFQN